MIRRKFLALVGVAAAAPALPAPVLKTATRVSRGGYAKLLNGWAAYHVQTGGVTTAAGLAPRLGVSAARASAIMTRLSIKSSAAAIGARFNMKSAARQVLAAPATPLDPQDAAPETTDAEI